MVIYTLTSCIRETCNISRKDDDWNGTSLIYNRFLFTKYYLEDDKY